MFREICEIRQKRDREPIFGIVSFAAWQPNAAKLRSWKKSPVTRSPMVQETYAAFGTFHPSRDATSVRGRERENAAIGRALYPTENAFRNAFFATFVASIGQYGMKIPEHSQLPRNRQNRTYLAKQAAASQSMRTITAHRKSTCVYLRFSPPKFFVWLASKLVVLIHRPRSIQ